MTDQTAHRGRRLLVVDDDAYLRLLLSLEMPDLVILEASRIEDGFDKAVAGSPDAIVVDCRLPDGDGLDLVRRLRADGSTRHTPIIVITAGHDESLREAVLDAGADDYLAKPVDSDDLQARLAEIFANATATAASVIRAGKGGQGDGAVGREPANEAWASGDADGAILSPASMAQTGDAKPRRSGLFRRRRT